MLTAFFWLLALFMAVLTLSVRPMGAWLAPLASGQVPARLAEFDRALLRLMGVRDTAMDWREYARAVLLFSLLGALLLYVLQRVQGWLKATFGAPFHDFAGSVVVHAVGGWLAFAAVLLLGRRDGRYRDGRLVAFAPSNIPFLALGSWILIVGWFGFNVMSAQTVAGISGLVAVNSLMAMVGGTVTALLVGRNDPGFLHNGPLAGLVAVCAGSDLMHPVGALITGAIAGALFVWAFTATQKSWKIDDVLGVWPLHGLCGVWGGIACGIFGQEALAGLGGVSLLSQLAGTAMGVVIALTGGFAVYGLLRATSMPQTGSLALT